MSEKRKETEKAIAHPIEGVLELEPETTLIPTIESEPTEMAVVPEFDAGDNEINEQFQEIYDVAMDAYEQQAIDVQTIEPKYRARNQEVAVQYLNAALNAAKEKASLKQNKEKMITKVATSGTKISDSQVIVADRNDVLKELFGRGN